VFLTYVFNYGTAEEENFLNTNISLFEFDEFVLNLIYTLKSFNFTSLLSILQAPKFLFEVLA